MEKHQNGSQHWFCPLLRQQIHRNLIDLFIDGPYLVRITDNQTGLDFHLIFIQHGKILYGMYRQDACLDLNRIDLISDDIRLKEGSIHC